MRSRKRSAAFAVLLLVAALSVVGCSSISTHREYFHPQIDLESVKRVAVVTFQNFTREPLAGEKVTDIFTTELSAAGLFNVVDDAQVRSFLSQSKIEADKVNFENLKKFKAALGVDAVLFGAVEEYAIQTVPGASFPLVAVTVRMVDTETGQVLWIASSSGSGESKTPIISIGETKTLPEMTHIVCARMTETLIRK